MTRTNTYEQERPFGVKINSEIRQQTLSVPRSEHYSKRAKLGENCEQ